MLESKYQAYLRKEIEKLLPSCFVMKNDTGYIQGVPDLIILYKNKWGVLEVKTHAGQRREPNQEYYIDMLNEMSFGAFIYPEIEEQVLNDLQQALEPRRHARVFKSK